jgi:perosamine synthetase
VKATATKSRAPARAGRRRRGVIVPTNTFAATAFAVLHAGARPVFADIGPDMTLDPGEVARLMRPATRAVVTVHLGGLVSPATADVAALCDEHGIPLVEDAAHAHGSGFDGRSAGTFGVAAAFSFFSTKVMTTGEGGMVVTDDGRLRDTVPLLRDQAKAGGGNVHEVVGNSWRMTEVQALMGLAQRRRLDEFIARRQRIAAVYDEGFAAAVGLRPCRCPPARTTTTTSTSCSPTGGRRGELRRRVKEQHGVSLAGFVYELPLHEQPVFAPWREGPLPLAEDLCRRHVCPPIYPSLERAAARHVVTALHEVLVGAAR